MCSTGALSSRNRRLRALSPRSALPVKKFLSVLIIYLRVVVCEARVDKTGTHFFCIHEKLYSIKNFKRKSKSKIFEKIPVTLKNVRIIYSRSIKNIITKLVIKVSMKEFGASTF